MLKITAEGGVILCFKESKVSLGTLMFQASIFCGYLIQNSSFSKSYERGGVEDKRFGSEFCF